jgi:uncharacterized protein YbjT (DUF2867 family)
MLIAVIGATGAQGGGIARAVLAHPEYGFSVRALTRYPDSEKARALADAGAEVVAADLDDPDSLKRAFQGADAAFCWTTFWENMDPARETRQAANMAQAARVCGVGHVIWSTFEDTRKWVPLDDDRMPTLMGGYKVPQFDAKADGDRFFAGLPVTYLLTSFYWEDFIHFGLGPRPSEDGMLALTLPLDGQRMPGIAAEDIGKCALGIFRRGPEMGQTFGIAGEHLSGQEMAEGLMMALGRAVRYDSVSPQEFRDLDFPAAESLGNMFQFMRDFDKSYREPRRVELARSLNPELMSFEDWLLANTGSLRQATLA